MVSPMMARRPSGSAPLPVGLDLANLLSVATSQRNVTASITSGVKASRHERMAVSKPASHGPISVASAQTTARMAKAGLTSRGARESPTRI